MNILEGRPYGRIYVYDPNTKAVKLLLDNLYVPNGIQVSPDQSALYFSETAAFRISKYQLTGKNAGQFEVIIDGLPGSPDNIKFNSKGELWVGIPSFRDNLSDNLMQSLTFRKLIARLP
jgi:sugar lactone lactonase YvrE